MRKKNYFLSYKQWYTTHSCLESLPKPFLVKPGSLHACLCGDIWVARRSIKNGRWSGRFARYWLRSDLKVHDNPEKKSDKK